MAMVTLQSQLMDGITISHIFDDVAMKLVGISYQHNGATNKRLIITFASPVSISLAVNAGTGTKSYTIPTRNRPSYTVGGALGVNINNMEWSIRLGA